MLKGYEHDWKNADRTRTVSYAALPTGHYTFMVKAFLLESPDKYDIKKITVIVPPYFLLSSGAIWIYMFLFAVAMLFLMFWRQKQLLIAAAQKGEKTDMTTSKNDNHTDTPNLMEQINEWLNQHSTNSQKTGDDMVADLGTTISDFEFQLKQQTGKTAKDVLTDHRMQQAIRYLEDTNENIAVIAYETGFGDATTFTRIFKSKTGDTPSTYRDAHRAALEEPTDSYEIIE
jgi:AraC-like DNA-binding protein